MKTKITVRDMALTGLLAALTVVGSTIRIAVPAVVGTNAFHLGNIMCALSGLLLGPWFGGLAAGLGSAIYDMLNPAYIQDAWITFLTKFAYGCVAGLVIGKSNGDFGYVRALIASAAGAVTYALLYFAKTWFYSGMFIKGLTFEAAALVTAGKIPATTFNAVVAVVFAPVLGLAITKALKKNNLLK